MSFGHTAYTSRLAINRAYKALVKRDFPSLVDRGGEAKPIER